MGASPVISHLDQLIYDALARAPVDWRALNDHGGRYAGRVVAARAPYLPEDLGAEVVNQAFGDLAQSDLSDLGHMSPRAFFRQKVLDALRRVRAAYTPPGQRTRGPRPPRETLVSQAYNRGPPLDARPDPAAEAAFRAAEQGLDARRILAAAPPVVACALHWMCFEDLEMSAAANRLGMDRFALKRRIKSFAESLSASV